MRDAAALIALDPRRVAGSVAPILETVRRVGPVCCRRFGDAR